jgi:AraC-like DNA-binding protein
MRRREVPLPIRPLRNTRFANPRLDAAGVETLSVAELRERVAPKWLAQSERVDFFMLLLVSRGEGEHRVDFERIGLQPGRVVFVRQGQAQQWQVPATYDGDVLLIAPAALQPQQTAPADSDHLLLRLDDWGNHFDIGKEEVRACGQLISLLRLELDTAAVTTYSAALARQLLLCVLLRLAPMATGPSELHSAAQRLVQRLKKELEGQVGERSSVEGLARRLGVSLSTLNRACRSELGRPAKALLDKRVALEAQRLLVHTEATSVAIAEQLGFGEATNFQKFFHRVVGVTPAVFRQRYRLSSGG